MPTLAIESIVLVTSIVVINAFFASNGWNAIHFFSGDESFEKDFQLSEQPNRKKYKEKEKVFHQNYTKSITNL
ncbi:MAG: hypothetical protein R2821_08985 [Flavobacteriaceae bacterium]